MGDRLATIDTGRKVGVTALPLSMRGQLDLHLTVWPGLGWGLPPYQVASWSVQPSGHNRHGWKIGGCALFGGSWVPINSVAWAEAYLHTKWHLDPSSRLATKDVDRRGGAMPHLGGRSWVPSNTMWPGPRPISVPSFILIHPTVCPQYTNVTDRTTVR